MRQYLKEIFELMGKDRKKLPWLLTLFFVTSFLDVLGIGLIAPYVSLVVQPELALDFFAKYPLWLDLPKDVSSMLIIMSGVLLGVFIVKTVSAIWINYKILQFTAALRIRLSTRLMESYQNLPYVEYLRRNSSEYIHTTQNLVADYANGAIQTGLGMVSNGIVAIAILLMLAYTDLMAFLLLCGLLSLFLFYYDRLFRKKIRLLGVNSNLASIKMVKGIHEGLDGLKEIRVLGNEEHFLNQVKEGITDASNFNMQSTVIGLIPRYLIELILIMFVVLLVSSSLIMGKNLQQLLPTLAIFGLASVRLLPIANILSNGLIKFRYNRDGVSRLFKDVISLDDVLTIQKDLPQNRNSEKSFKELSLESISFIYPNAKHNALLNISLKIKRGDSIGIIGESGSGKTTLIDAILGMLKPNSGEIYFNGSPLNKEMYNWHRQVAYLPQEIFLVDDKLKNNVALGVDEKDIDVKLLNDSLERASLSELINQLPDGIDTVLGERGVRLSGGQRQRISLARAFYHKRDILVLDESTSALDHETEKEIVDEIKRLKGDVTMIVIAHRFSTIENCDVIYRIKNGEIVDSGFPDDMLGLNNKYRGQ
jgi:ATP-binding cassette, subfamily B, bacterial PglK